jgi:hypothetical protein
VDTALPLRSEQSPTETARYGKLSVVCAALTIVVPIIIGLIFTGAEEVREQQGTAGNGWAVLGRLIVTFFGAVLTAALLAAVGIVTGVASLARGERPAWFAAVGLLVCVPVVALTVVVYVASYL